MKYGSGPIRKFGTNNNVNICINVNKYEKESNSEFDNLTYLHDKVISLTSDINLLKHDVLNLSSIEQFEQNLSKYINFTEMEKIKSLINDQSYEALSGFITNYNSYVSLLEGIEKIKYKETIVNLTEYTNSENPIITAIIDGESVIINDITDTDNDPTTIYKIPIKGLIIGMEMYYMKEDESENIWVGGWKSFNGLNTVYDSENKSSYIYLEEGDFKDIFSENRPNNKLKIYSLTIE